MLQIHAPFRHVSQTIQKRSDFRYAATAFQRCLKSELFFHVSFIGLYNSYNFFHLILKLLVTTDTELKAIAAAAIIGLSKKPLIPYNTPAAKGIPIIL